MNKIIIGSADWEVLQNRLHRCKDKSNRDVLCTICWEMMSYERSIKHKEQFESHACHVVTSKDYANIQRFLFLAKSCGKHDSTSGEQVILSPIFPKKF